MKVRIVVDVVWSHTIFENSEKGIPLRASLDLYCWKGQLTPWTGRVTMIGMKIFFFFFSSVGGVICPPNSPIKCTTKLKARILVFNIRIPITKGFTVSRNAHSYERIEFTALKWFPCGHLLWCTWCNFPVFVGWAIGNYGTRDTPLSIFCICGNRISWQLCDVDSLSIRKLWADERCFVQEQKRSARQNVVN